ncbi:right-handed parallel beta-helix repeat-containing protein [Arenibacter sp. ARW7G5Y1]|uniref:right-handed parallel beta-helix repeat-containing protein n=1 Tax=Arenibacter sp. ARW7G5Y1 TaxID=2135619 RepID=UPI000D7689B1|nr:right-handed parallel beta-helix repeat-containing protein [Arenibacter sp. ARW7G5Y1]PXX23027.1 parallel beta helix pectate lyase-like protein [Arenibacter sp. ARW7G5Y1]
MKLNLMATAMCTLFLFIKVFPQDVYVGPSGNDNNMGTKTKPVATLEAARNLVRQYKAINDLPKGGITVWIGKGQYDQTEPFILNENDSGSPDAPIVWRTLPNEPVSVTGGKSIPVEKFEKVTNSTILKRLSKNAAKNVLQVNLKELGINDFGQIKQYGHAMSVVPAPMEVFFNNEAMDLARYPNEGYIKIGKVLDPGSVPRNRDYSNRGGIFEYTDPRHALWAGQKDVWFQGSFNYGYADDNILVETIDTQKKQIKLAMPSLYGVAHGRDFQHYVAYNILDELDSPGEWYVDKKSGMLYFWPPTAIEESSMIVSILEDPIISLEGASFVTIRDLTIEVGRGIGVYMERGTNNLIAGCTVRNVGTNGIFMGQGAEQTFPLVTHDDYEGVPVSRRIGNLQGHIYKYTAWDRNAGSNHGILSCDVYNTGSGGIFLSGGSKRKLIPGNNYVENSKVHDYNRRNKFLWSGINIDGCGNRISHCEIFNSEWQGIYVHGNEHLFEYNDIHHVTLNSDDTSPWYIGRDPSDRGNIIRYNYFHHCGNPNRMNMGIYCDDSSTDVLVFGNVFYKMNTKHGILFTNSGWDLKMKNNIVIEPISYTAEISAHYYTWYSGGGPPMFGEDGLLRRRLLNNVKITEAPYAEKYPELLNYLNPIVDGKEWEGMRARRNELSGNLIIGGPENPLHLVGGVHAQCEDIKNYRTDHDPGFVDFKNENFNLRTDSEVFNKIPGFEALPFDKMGLYIDEYRKSID